MTVRIEMKKVVDKVKGKMYVVSKIEGVMKRDELPQKYFTKQPYFYRVGKETVFIYDCNSRRREVYVGKKMSEKEAKDIEEALEIAGEKLEIIRKEFKEMEKEWQGNYTIIV